MIRLERRTLLQRFPILRLQIVYASTFRIEEILETCPPYERTAPGIQAELLILPIYPNPPDP